MPRCVVVVELRVAALSSLLTPSCAPQRHAIPQAAQHRGMPETDPDYPFRHGSLPPVSGTNHVGIAFACTVQPMCFWWRAASIPRLAMAGRELTCRLSKSHHSRLRVVNRPFTMRRGGFRHPTEAAELPRKVLGWGGRPPQI